MKTLKIVAIILLCGIIFFIADSIAMDQNIADKRNIRTGWEIPTESYSDQPYVIKTDDGAWLCIVTTGGGHERHIFNFKFSIDNFFLYKLQY